MVQDTKVCWCGLRGRVIAAGQCQLVLMSQLFHEFTQGEIVQFLPLGSFRRIPQRSQPVSYSEIQLEPLQNLPAGICYDVRVIFLTMNLWQMSTRSGNTEALPSWVSWRLILRLTDDWSHRPSPYASRLEAVGGVLRMGADRMQKSTRPNFF